MLELTERKKGDRAKMARFIAELVTSLGAKATIHKEGSDLFRPRCTWVDIDAGHGLFVSVYFDGRTRQLVPDTYVLSWYIGIGSKTRLTADFARAAKATVNTFHGQKATSVAYGIGNLEYLLRDALACVKDGSAFEEKESIET